MREDEKIKTGIFHDMTFLPSRILIGSILNEAIIALIWTPKIPIYRKKITSAS